jgi:hydroxypyruvate reductase
MLEDNLYNSVKRTTLLGYLATALAAVQGRNAVREYLSQHQLEGDAIAVLAIGKAAFSMMEGAIEVLDSRIATGMLITKVGHLGNAQAFANIETLFGGHPLPDERSLQAGDRLVSWLSSLPPSIPVLVLISGGTSALVEKLPADVSLADLQKLNQWLLSSGLPIDRINRIRRSVSLIKGGRLLKLLGDRSVTQLLISDVPGDVVSDIGSGLFVRPTSAESIDIKLPDWIVRMQEQAQTITAKPFEAKPNIHSEIIASNRIACAALKRAAEQSGYTATVVSTELKGDVINVSQEIGAFLKNARRGCYIWGGETTVRLPKNPGRGGRNQQLALLLAKELQLQSGLYVLCAGTDGTDGPTEDAGALVDGDTVERGYHEGFDVDKALVNADAGSFLAASGDLINTGPTGTNVMDLVIALKG